MANLADLITSKVRIKILELFFSNTKEIYHVRGVVRQIKEEINAVRRELGKMEKDGLVKKEPRGNRIYYYLREDYPFYGDLISMVAKTTGIGEQLIQNKNKLGKVSLVMFSRKFVLRKDRKKEDDVDILIVGEANLADLATMIRSEESKRNKEINYTVMSREEFEFRKKRRDPFLLSIMLGGRVFILGSEEDLVN